MPELPEVETIRIGLEKHLIGHTIESIEIRLAKQFFGDPGKITGAKVVAVRRFGKGLVIDLSNGYSLAVHAKMTGQLIYRRVSGVSGVSSVSEANFEFLPDKYTHVIFSLNNGCALHYRDIRQFGWIKSLKTSEVAGLPFFKGLGLDPLKDLTIEKFAGLLQKSKTPVKLFLMDQSKIAGIGNIYANDSLYLAGILPKRPANSLSGQEVKMLFHAIQDVLRKSIQAGGASANNYVNALGEKGSYQDHFLVYKKTGQACKKCGTAILQMRLGGRGTFFCPVCQK